MPESKTKFGPRLLHLAFVLAVAICAAFLVHPTSTGIPQLVVTAGTLCLFALVGFFLLWHLRSALTAVLTGNLDPDADFGTASSPAQTRGFRRFASWTGVALLPVVFALFGVIGDLHVNVSTTLLWLALANSAGASWFSALYLISRRNKSVPEWVGIICNMMFGTLYLAPLIPFLFLDSLGSEWRPPDERHAGLVLLRY